MTTTSSTDPLVDLAFESLRKLLKSELTLVQLGQARSLFRAGLRKVEKNIEEKLNQYEEAVQTNG